MATPKGGRGHKAPYETTHVRIPVPIKGKVETLIEEFRLEVIDGVKPVRDDKLSLESAKEKARKLLRAKTSKLETMARLLTLIYGEEVTTQELQGE